MTDVSSNGTGTPGLGDTVMAKAPTKPAKSAAESARTFADAPQGELDALQQEGVSRLGAAVERIEARAAELREWSSARADQARELVEDKPLTVIGAAFGVGLLLGLIAAR